MAPDRLSAAVEAGFTGDPDELVDLLDDDVVWLEAGQPPLQGTDAVLSHLLAYGGRRELAQVHEAVVVAEAASLTFSVWFRADSHAYAQRWRVMLDLTDAGLITAWRALWIEEDSDLEPWSGD